MQILEDLGLSVSQTKKRVESLPLGIEYAIPNWMIEKVVESYNREKTFVVTAIGNQALHLRTGERGRRRFFSTQEWPLLLSLGDFVKKLSAYQYVLIALAEEMKCSPRNDDRYKKYWEKLPSLNWKDDLIAIDGGERFLNQLHESLPVILPDPEQQNLFVRFLSDPEWSGIEGGKSLERPDDWQSAVMLKIGNLVANANDGRFELVQQFNALGINYSDLNGDASGDFAVGGTNEIYFGAPGTGKTYSIDKAIKDNSILNVRTVFHPDVQNSDFVGSLKPVMKEDSITYAFAAGPFAEALRLAYCNLDKPVYLVIEEINRAAAAAVFGDLFLLLDRDRDGQSQYSVAFPNEEFKKWFCEKTETQIEELRLPSNLSIFATMNSADQGVYPLDTAFRRRWKQKYLPLDFDVGTVPNVDLNIVESSSNTFSVKWSEFAKKLNDFLQKKLDIQEDRLIGPYFISADEVVEGKVPEKLLIYLWDDLLRHGERSRVFQKSIGTYGELSANITEEKVIWCEDVLAALTPSSA